MGDGAEKKIINLAKVETEEAYISIWYNTDTDSFGVQYGPATISLSSHDFRHMTDACKTARERFELMEEYDRNDGEKE